MIFASATDHAIRVAYSDQTLRVRRRPSRFGDFFWSIEDESGLIEVHNSRRELEERFDAVLGPGAVSLDA